VKIKTQPDAIAKLMTGLVAVLPEATSIFRKALKSSQVDLPAVAKQMHKAELESDDRHEAFLTKVAATFITPFDREDLLDMAETLDAFVDHLDHAVDLLVRFEFKELPQAFLDGADDLDAMANIAASAVEVIKKPKKFRPLWGEVDAIEDRMDMRNNEVLADVLSGRHDPLTAMKLIKIQDAIEDCANMLEGFVTALARAAIKET